MGEADCVHNSCRWFPSCKSISTLFACFLSGIKPNQTKTESNKQSFEIQFKLNNKINTYLSKKKEKTSE